MQENDYFAPDEATTSNLSSLALAMSRVDEARLYEIADLAASAVGFSLEMLRGELGIYEILSMLSESISFGEYSIDEGSLAESERMLSLAMGTMSMNDRIAFVLEYALGMKEAGHPFTDMQFLERAGEGERLGYVRNQYSDEAYDVFSQDFRDPRVRYYPSFKECAAALESGEIDYILLPLEERGGVRLPTVAELIYRKDFRISAVTPVFGFDLGADMKYALVGRGFKQSRHRQGDDRYIELRLSQSADISFAELLAVSESLGLTAYRVNTLTFDTEGEEETYFFAVLREGGAGFASLLLYLTMFADDYTVVGLYKNLE